MTTFSAGPAGWAAAFLLAAVLAGNGAAIAQEVQFLEPEVGDRRVVLRWNRAPGDTLDALERQNCVTACPEDSSCCREQLFGGYQVWRSLSPDPDKMVLIRTYSIFDTTWTFTGDERIFADPDSILIRGCAGIPGLDEDECDPLTGRAIGPFNGFRYYYAITWFESSLNFVGGLGRVVETQMQTRAEGSLPEPVKPAAPAVTTSPLLGGVRVVPNPFNASDPEGKGAFRREERLQFINLPSPATVRIYTISGDLVQVLENTDLDGAVDWDLKNGDGEDVVPGIYMFVAETDGGKQRRNGHFVIIR